MSELRGRFRHGFIWLAGLWLLGALLVAPPGASVCWQWLGMNHIHIGWSEPNGGEALHLTVFTHDESQTVNYSSPVSLASASPAEYSSFTGDMLPAPNAVWLLPCLTLWWLLSAQSVVQRQPGVQPRTPPPRAV